MHTVLDLFQHKTTSDIVFDDFWIKKWNFSLGPISGLIDPPPLVKSILRRLETCIRVKGNTSSKY